MCHSSNTFFGQTIVSHIWVMPLYTLPKAWHGWPLNHKHHHKHSHKLGSHGQHFVFSLDWMSTVICSSQCGVYNNGHFCLSMLSQKMASTIQKPFAQQLF